MTGTPVSVAAAQIDALLPQTQCTRCGYAGCAPYAAAIAAGSADINQCPPGGTETIAALAALLQRPVLGLNPTYGQIEPPRVAWINESLCIGCAKCLAPCPVDAIVGAAKYTHTVIMDRCTGCELCIPPCPVDCIELRPASASAHNDAASNRARFAAHTDRIQERARAREREIAANKADLLRRLSASS